MSKSFLNNHSVRGLRNNNPGNLIRTSLAWQGKIPFAQSKDNHFEQFHNLHFGIRAMLKDLINDINKGKNTVSKLIHEYAPSSENDTNAYIQSVCKTIGVQPNTLLSSINSAFLLNLVRAILKVELGTAHTDVTNNDILTSIGMLGTVSTPTLKVDTKTDLLTLIKNNSKPIILGLLVFFYSYVSLTI